MVVKSSLAKMLAKLWTGWRQYIEQLVKDKRKTWEVKVIEVGLFVEDIPREVLFEQNYVILGLVEDSVIDDDRIGAWGQAKPRQTNS